MSEHETVRKLIELSADGGIVARGQAERAMKLLKVGEARIRLLTKLARAKAELTETAHGASIDTKFIYRGLLKVSKNQKRLVDRLDKAEALIKELSKLTEEINEFDEEGGEDAEKDI